MSTEQFFATRFCTFRCAIFLHETTLQKTKGYIGVMQHIIKREINNGYQNYR